jgi:hypothetical protein
MRGATAQPGSSAAPTAPIFAPPRRTHGGGGGGQPGSRPAAPTFGSHGKPATGAARPEGSSSAAATNLVPLVPLGIRDHQNGNLRHICASDFQRAQPSTTNPNAFLLDGWMLGECLVVGTVSDVTASAFPGHTSFLLTDATGKLLVLAGKRDLEACASVVQNGNLVKVVGKSDKQTVEAYAKHTGARPPHPLITLFAAHPLESDDEYLAHALLAEKERAVLSARAGTPFVPKPHAPSGAPRARGAHSGGAALEVKHAPAGDHKAASADPKVGTADQTAAGGGHTIPAGGHEGASVARSEGTMLTAPRGASPVRLTDALNPTSKTNPAVAAPGASSAAGGPEATGKSGAHAAGDGAGAIGLSGKTPDAGAAADAKASASEHALSVAADVLRAITHALAHPDPLDNEAAGGCAADRLHKELSFGRQQIEDALVLLLDAGTIHHGSDLRRFLLTE